VIIGFVDKAINELLGLDPEREGALTLVPLGDTATKTPTPSPEMEPLHLETMPLSKKEVDYPAIRAMHTASSLDSQEEVIAWRKQSAAGGQAGTTREPKGRLVPLQPLPDQEMPGDTIEQVIMRRGSTRQFSQESISFAQLSTMLKQATGGIPGDFSNGGHSQRAIPYCQCGG